MQGQNFWIAKSFYRLISNAYIFLPYFWKTKMGHLSPQQVEALWHFIIIKYMSTFQRINQIKKYPDSGHWYNFFVINWLLHSEYCQRSRLQRKSWKILIEYQSHMVSPVGNRQEFKNSWSRQFQPIAMQYQVSCSISKLIKGVRFYSNLKKKRSLAALVFVLQNITS